MVGETADSEPLLKYYANRPDKEYYMCDMFEYKGDMQRFRTFSLCRINDMQYDCIIITAKANAAAIKKVLVEEHGIDLNVIIEFWKMYNAYIPLMVCDRIMLNPQHSSFDGLICGLSHTEVGILTDKLGGDDVTFCNLSVSSQDMYFQYKTIEYCYQKFPHKLKNLKYAIIETYDYNYFNFDTSKGKAAFEYLGWGGYNLDPHNFNDNRRLDFTFDQAMQGILNNKYKSISEENVNMWEIFCKDVFAYNDFKGFEGNFDVKKRTSIVTDEQIDGFFYNRSVVAKVFPDTIKENIDMFRKILELLKAINPDIKIYSVMVPRYRETQIRDQRFSENHIGYFKETINTFKKEYGFEHLDLTDNEIADHRNYYFDAVHLNLFGAEAFTQLLNKIIFDI